MAVDVVRQRTVRLPVGLLLSIGAEKPDRGPGRPIDYIRAKPGQLGQFEAEAAKFVEVYGAEPKELRDVYFISNEVPAVLDIRLLAFSQSGIRGVGDTNYAAITDESEFEEHVFGAAAFKDGFTFFPKDVSEVRPELKESWEGEPIHGELDGRNDPRVERLQVKTHCSLEFCLPEVMGVGKVARISTSGRASTRNLWKAMWTEQQAFGGSLMGVPFRLALRPRSTQRFEREEKKYVQTTVYELVIDTPHTVAELRRAIEQHRQTFGLPSPERLRVEGRALRGTLALPPAEEATEQVREEPDAAIPDWLQNRIVAAERETGEEAQLLVLRGVFGVETVAELDPDQALRYVEMLETALAPAEDAEGEVVDEGSAGGEGLPAGAALPRNDAAPTPADESGAESSAASEVAAAGSSDGPRHSPATEHEPSASDLLPGEPIADATISVEAAGEMLVPIGGNRGKKLSEVADDWLTYALKNPKWFEEHKDFWAALELWVENERSGVWEYARG